MFNENNIKGTEKTFFIEVGIKKYPLVITKTNEKGILHIKCKGANLDQTYLEEDLYLLFEDIEGLIKDYQLEKKDSVFQMRLTATQKMQLEKNAKKSGFNHLSDFIKSRCLA